MGTEHLSGELVLLNFPSGLQTGALSGLQSFETALMLISLGRWPSVIPLVWSACESLLRSKYKDNDTEVWRLQEDYYGDNNGLVGDLHRKAKKFRRLRNDIQHSGYSPKDDPICMEVFFDTAIPYLEHLVKNVLDESLSDSFKNERLPWLLRKTRKAIANKRLSEPEHRAVSFFLTKFMKWTLSPNFASVRDQLLMDQSYSSEAIINSEGDLKTLLCDALEALPGHDGWTYELVATEGHDGCLNAGVNCPACNETVFAVAETCQRDDRHRFKKLIGAGCWSCSYLLSVELHENLLGAFFQDEINQTLIDKIEGDAPPFARGTFAV